MAKQPVKQEQAPPASQATAPGGAEPKSVAPPRPAKSKRKRTKKAPATTTAFHGGDDFKDY